MTTPTVQWDDMQHGIYVASLITEEVHQIVSLLQSSVGFYRPSFAQFYQFFYWEPPASHLPLNLSIQSLNVAVNRILSPIESVLLRKQLQQSETPQIISQSIRLAVLSCGSLSLVLSPALLLSKVLLTVEELELLPFCHERKAKIVSCFLQKDFQL